MFEVFMSYKLCRTSYSQKYFFSLSHYFLVILFHQSNIKKAEKCFCSAWWWWLCRSKRGAHTEVNKSINNIKLQPDLYEQALGSLGSRRGNVAIDSAQETIQPKQLYIFEISPAFR